MHVQAASLMCKLRKENPSKLMPWELRTTKTEDMDENTTLRQESGSLVWHDIAYYPESTCSFGNLNKILPMLPVLFLKKIMPKLSFIVSASM